MCQLAKPELPQNTTKYAPRAFHETFEITPWLWQLGNVPWPATMELSSQYPVIYAVNLNSLKY